MPARTRFMPAHTSVSPLLATDPIHPAPDRAGLHLARTVPHRNRSTCTPTAAAGPLIGTTCRASARQARDRRTPAAVVVIRGPSFTKDGRNLR